MGILEEIKQMRNQGIDDKEISDRLQEKGIAPKAINDAFNQMRIKNAVSAEPNEEEMQQSMMSAPITQKTRMPASNLYTPKTQEINGYSEQELYAPQPEETGFYPEQEYAQEEYYPQEGYEEYGGGGYDTDTLIEIAEQVFSEKIKKIQKQVEVLNEFATLAETKISNNHERIKRTEAIIDKLQVAILEKIGSYGKNIEGVKRELEMMQDSFGKVIPKLHEQHSPHHHEPAHTEHKTKKKTSKKK